MENKRFFQGSLTKEQAFQKLKYYCSYQERSHYEVQQKLWELKVRKADHDEIISNLIEEDYLNEERFVRSFAGGKFRMKSWGRVKIKSALREKNISNYLLQIALKEIDEDDYLATLKSLAEKKYFSLKSEQYLIRKKKTIDYLLQKGYEQDLIHSIINQIKKDNNEI